MPGYAAVLALARILPEGSKLVDGAVRVGLIAVLGFLVQRLLFLLVGRVETWVVRASKDAAHARQRAHTLGQILRNLCTVLVVVAVVIDSLAIFGLDVRPLLAGAGLLGVALGFGAQWVVRDVIAGLFILAEDQFSVGDLIEVNGRPATVEQLTVRSTVLRDFNGHLHFVPNGEMKVVVNRSRGWSRLAVDIPVAADQDVERALGVCEQVATELNHDAAWRARLLDPIEVWGVESLSGSEALVRMVVRARPGPDAPEAAREVRRRVALAFVRARLRMASQREITIQPVAGGREAAASPAD